MSNLTTSIEVNKQTKYKLNNGTEIPIFGYGCYLLAQHEPPQKAVDLVYAALEAGYRHVDSAQGYKNEQQAAQGIARFLEDHPEVSREDIYFTTKIKNESQGYEKTLESLKETSAKVVPYIDYVDLVLIHNPISSPEERLGTWKALQELVLNPSNRILKIKSIGVSNYGIDHLEELFNWEGYRVKPVLNQLELHPWLSHLKLREYLSKHDILAEAYSPLTQGYLLNDPELLEFEKKFNMSKAEILLKWSVLQGFVVLVKSDKVERIKSNISILPDIETDELGATSVHGKVDLDPAILEAFDKPDSHIVTSYGGKDPTLYVHHQ